MNRDSAAIFKIDGKVFVNQNDCKIFDRLGYLEHYDVDYYAVQFSGLLGTVCYDLTEDQKRELSLRKVRSKLRAVKSAIRLIKPKYYIPSAGPAIFPFLTRSSPLVNTIFLFINLIFIGFYKMKRPN